MEPQPSNLRAKGMHSILQLFWKHLIQVDQSLSLRLAYPICRHEQLKSQEDSGCEGNLELG